jgi:hypothetical protein
MEKKTKAGTEHESPCCARGQTVLKRFGNVLRYALMSRLGRIALFLLMSLAVVLCVTGLGFAQLADSPWPMRGHDAKHTGQSPYKGPQFANLKWKFETEGDICSSPAIDSDGTV